MKLIKISEIQVLPNRQRRVFDEAKLFELRESIERIGLQMPPVIRYDSHWHKPILVSGERRLRAVQEMHDFELEVRFEGGMVPKGAIPVLELTELTELEAEEAEFDENIKRTDLTWQEKATTLASLQRLRERQGKPATVAAIAEETYVPKREGMGTTSALDATRKALIVAKHLDRPEVAQAKTLEEGFKALMESDKKTRNEALAAAVGKVFTSADHSISQGDSLELMAQLPAESFDVIITDPPYGIDAQGFSDADGRLVTQDHHYDDSYEAWKPLIQRFVVESTRLGKREAHAYICCDIDRFHEIKGLMQENGWYVFRTPLINFKLDGSRVPLPSHGPQRKWEMILYAIKGNKPVTRIYPDVVQTRGDENLGHGAQKPVGLYLDLLKRSCVAGDRVLDPFAGTGTVFVAAHELKVAATGFELNPNYYGIALKRIQGLK